MHLSHGLRLRPQPLCLHALQLCLHAGQLPMHACRGHLEAVLLHDYTFYIAEALTTH